jgi:hypothetical protein
MTKHVSKLSFRRDVSDMYDSMSVSNFLVVAPVYFDQEIVLRWLIDLPGHYVVLLSLCKDARQILDPHGELAVVDDIEDLARIVSPQQGRSRIHGLGPLP